MSTCYVYDMLYFCFSVLDLWMWFLAQQHMCRAAGHIFNTIIHSSCLFSSALLFANACVFCCCTIHVVIHVCLYAVVGLQGLWPRVLRNLRCVHPVLNTVFTANVKHPAELSLTKVREILKHVHSLQNLT